MAREPAFTCDGLENASEVCKLNPPCSQYVYNLTEFSSLVADLNLVCDRKLYVEYCMSVFFLGIFVGVLIMGALADRIGRHKVMSAGIVLWIISSFSIAAVQSVWQLLIIRFLCGFLGGGAGLVSYVLLTEMISSNRREFVGFLFNSTFSIGFAVYGFCAYLIYDWRLLSVVSISPVLFTLCNIIILPESPRWLATNGKVTQAENILYQIGKKNGKKIERSLIALKQVTPLTKENKYTYVDLVRTRVMLKRNVIQWINWFTCSLVYYGLSLSSATLGGSPYVSFALSGLIEIPANLFAYVFMRCFGRKPCMLVSYFLGGVGCVGLLVIQPNDSNSKTALARTLLAMIGKFGISSAFTGIYVYSVELIPTVVRNSGMGICSMFARIGGIIAPQLDTMGNTPMYVIYGVSCFVTGFANFFLPETLNKPLPETINEIEGVPYKLVAQDSDDEDAQIFSDGTSGDMDWDIGTGLLEGQATSIDDGRLGENITLHNRRSNSNDLGHMWEIRGEGKTNGMMNGIEMKSVHVYDYVDDEVEILFQRSNTQND
ncbi:solute carrier family 22 member 15-like isoform X2 [Antedon mediterranea]|uniref:solute carrier family 22 member 15-like isoform X2 n=1 Tax=Antedon mediterranea TaxID=105859 RepID=UPI003AF5E9E6